MTLFYWTIECDEGNFSHCFNLVCLVHTKYWWDRYEENEKCSQYIANVFFFSYANQPTWNNLLHVTESFIRISLCSCMILTSQICCTVSQPNMGQFNLSI